MRYLKRVPFAIRSFMSLMAMSWEQLLILAHLEEVRMLGAHPKGYSPFCSGVHSSQQPNRNARILPSPARTLLFSYCRGQSVPRMKRTALSTQRYLRPPHRTFQGCQDIVCVLCICGREFDKYILYYVSDDLRMRPVGHKDQASIGQRSPFALNSSALSIDPPAPPLRVLWESTNIL